jgi:sec-independent protein translocase protein TatC
VYFGVIPYRVLRENWRVVYVTVTVVAAMITPDWSPVSMLSLAAAMIALYELSMLTVRVVLSRRIKARDEALAIDEAD